jgi:hypothetical protein
LRLHSYLSLISCPDNVTSLTFDPMRKCANNVLLLLSVLKQVAPIRAASSVSLRWIQTGMKNQWIDSHDGDNINDNNNINDNTIKIDDNLDDSTNENKDNNGINDNTDNSTVAGVLKTAAF